MLAVKLKLRFYMNKFASPINITSTLMVGYYGTLMRF